MMCPRCHIGLREEHISSIPLATCTSCRGTWYFAKGLKKLLRVDKNLDFLNLSHDLFHRQKGDLQCPECDIQMEAKTFHKDGGLTIDQCTDCQGIWLDKGELVKTKKLIATYLRQQGEKTLGKSRKFHPLRAYPVPKTKTLPKVLPAMPDFHFEESRDERAEEIELEAGTEAAERSIAIWLFTIFTGMPVEAYNPPRRKFPFVVLTLILINVIISLFVLSMSFAEIRDCFKTLGATPNLVFNGNWIAVITYAFLHGGWLHLVGNMYFLWLFGDNIEDKLGHFGFIVFYTLCALVAILCQLFVAVSMNAGGTPIVGASGAIAGVMGAYLYLFPKAAFYQTIIIPYPFKIPATLYFFLWIALQFFGVAAEMRGVAWWAHLGGFFCGLGLCWLWYSFRKASRPITA